MGRWGSIKSIRLQNCESIFGDEESCGFDWNPSQVSFIFVAILFSFALLASPIFLYMTICERNMEDIQKASYFSCAGLSHFEGLKMDDTMGGLPVRKGLYILVWIDIYNEL